MRVEVEREFFHLAGIYLAARWRAMGGTIDDPRLPTDNGDLAFELLGMHDYAQEMKLLLQSEVDSRQKREATPAVSLPSSLPSLPSEPRR